MFRSLQLALILAPLLLSASTPARADTWFWYCNTNPGANDKNIYVTDIFGPFAPDPDKVVAQADVRADFMVYIRKNHADALVNHKGTEERVIACSGSTQRQVTQQALNDIKKIIGRGHTVVETHWTDPEGMAGKGAHLKRIDPKADSKAAPKAGPKAVPKAN